MRQLSSERGSNWLYIKLNCSGRQERAILDNQAGPFRSWRRSQRGPRDKAFWGGKGLISPKQMIPDELSTRRRKCPCELRRQTRHQREKVDGRKLQDNRGEMPHQERWFCETTKKETNRWGNSISLGKLSTFSAFDGRTREKLLPFRWCRTCELQ